MSLLGPQGFREIGELIITQSHDAARRLAEIPGIAIRHPSGFFTEFVVDFSGTGKSVAAINKKLRKSRIFGGKDLTPEGMKQCALYCVTEVHSTEDIDRLAQAIAQAVKP
jgi:glycine dehydrogenase subunit 1